MKYCSCKQGKPYQNKDLDKLVSLCWQSYENLRIYKPKIKEKLFNAHSKDKNVLDYIVEMFLVEHHYREEK